MIDINRVVLVGRLTRDAEIKSVGNGLTVCNFSIAVNRRKKNGDQWEDEASFFDIAVWGRQAENLHQYLVKGKLVGVDGELRQDRWQQPDGQNRSRIEIVASNVQLLGGNPAGSAGGGQRAQAPGGGYGYSVNAQDSAPANPVGSTAAGDHFADDIPF